ncbi:DUF2064 domain-containing protein [Microbacterium sp. NEAU-LLC]|uniref:DUF2064 domain-containing protein n=1 Tax=Microbacterium helvum TaxID=2773713 RepID=A0ABR8NLV8_9MICO|nr:DUF2064 domain-containing protein [Microbacterium helvum]MBD3940506.1 DUF2064 domain-containing protein [Microbacterium helvum]
MTTIVVMAKECRPGRVKTRLHPPFTLQQAARIAEASLLDTITTVSELPAQRRVLCFDGDTAPPLPMGWEVVAQTDGTLDERIAYALSGCDGPTVLVGMDTPQFSIGDVAAALTWPADIDAWLGPATDGGFWALALRRPDSGLVRGVAMSRADTGARQRQRLEEAGLRVAELPTLTDIDDAAALDEVAAQLTDGHLARLLQETR